MTAASEIDESSPLLDEYRDELFVWWKAPRWRIFSLVSLVVLFVLGFPTLLFAFAPRPQPEPEPPTPPAHNATRLRIFSFNTWGVPGKLGAQDKEARMVEIGKVISRTKYDIYLLTALWMKADHETIKSFVPEDWYMTETYDLAVYGACDGKVLPTGCSGLAIVSRFPFLEIDFHEFSKHGDFWWKDGEYFLRKGVGRVRIEPRPHVRVDLFVTQTTAQDYNSYYREIQAREIVDQLVTSSGADFAILGGDLNVDPRRMSSEEQTYGILTANLSNAMLEFFHSLDECLKPSRATYGNPTNTYSSGEQPQLFDYILYHNNNSSSIRTEKFDVVRLKGKIYRNVKEMSAFHLFSNSTVPLEQEPVMVSLSNHEAVTASLLLIPA